jgi:dTDP-4-amino-4,6-dideoxygalactose transaminase
MLRLDPPRAPEGATPNWQSYLVRLRGADAEARNGLLDALARRGVATRPGLMAIHAQPCYAGARIAGSLRHTEEAAAQTFILPMYTDLTEADQDAVIEALRDSLAETPARSADASATGGRR